MMAATNAYIYIHVFVYVYIYIDVWYKLATPTMCVLIYIYVKVCLYFYICVNIPCVCLYLYIYTHIQCISRVPACWQPNRHVHSLAAILIVFGLCVVHKLAASILAARYRRTSSIQFPCPSGCQRCWQAWSRASMSSHIPIWLPARWRPHTYACTYVHAYISIHIHTHILCR